MKPSLHQLAFDGALLERGFWLYIWEITTKERETVHYVGRNVNEAVLNCMPPSACTVGYSDLHGSHEPPVGHSR